MTRKAFNTTLGKQVAILPVENGLKVTQGPNPAKDGFIPSNNYIWSHKGYHAIDHCDSAEINFYAPFDMMCVKHEYFGNVCFTFFTSLEEVVCASESLPIYVSMVCIHGGDPEIVGEDENGNSVTKLNVGVIIRQGNKCYEWGHEGDYSTGDHIHFEVMKGSLPKKFNYSSYMKSYNQDGVNNTSFPADGFTHGSYAEDIFFKLPTDTVEFIGSGSEWSNHINFKTYTGKLEWNGWIADGSEWYYYENGVKVSGWLKTSDGTFYLDPNNGNAMLTGWFKEGGSNYYFNPKAGEAGHQEKYVGGVMLTGWQWIDEHWYLFGEGGVMQTGWVWSDAWQGWYYLYTSGAEAGQMAVSTWIDKVYYVGSDGKMYKGGVFTVDGVKYSFDNSGVATRI